jgi:hypothetical protein
MLTEGSGVTPNDAGHLVIPTDYVDPAVVQPRSLLARVSMRLSEAAEVITPTLMSPLERMSSMLQSTLQGSFGASGRLDELMEEISAEVDTYKLKSDSIDISYFTDPGANGVKIRGKDYFKDKKKVDAVEPVCCLTSANLLEVQPTFHIARFLPSIKDSKAPFTFVLQIMVPGKPGISLTFGWSADYDPVAPADKEAAEGRRSHPGTPTHRHTASNASDVSAFEHDQLAQVKRMASLTSKTSRSLPGTPTGSFTGERDKECMPVDRCVRRFVAGDDDMDDKRRHGTFKLIPRVTQGSWLIRNAVGSTPVLLGKKLTTKYFRGPRYFEVDIDVSSSSSANHVVGMVQGALKSLVIDLAVLLEGHFQDELPEALLGAVRLNNLDLSKAARLDLATGTITRKDGA